MREFINKQGKYIFVIALVLAGATFWFFGRTKVPDVSRAFFVDEDTGEESVASLAEYPPRMGKNGKPTVVQEIKYTCDGGKTQKVAYYVKYTDETKKHLEKLFAETGKPSGTDVTNSTLVRSPEKGSKWVPMGSPEATAFTIIRCPEGGEIETVLP